MIVLTGVTFLVFMRQQNDREKSAAEVRAAHAACVENRPRTILLLTALRDNARQAVSDINSLDRPLTQAQKDAVKRNAVLANTLNQLLAELPCG